MPQLPLFIYFILIALLVSLVTYWQPEKNFYLRIFPPFLLISIIVETFAMYLWDNGQENVWVYNFFTTFEFCFYLYVLSNIISQQKMKKAVLYTMFIYLGITIINLNS